MKYLMLLILVSVCVAEVPFSLQFRSEQEIDTWIAELRGIDIQYPGILAILYCPTYVSSRIRGYMLDTWEQYYSYSYGYEIRGICTNESGSMLHWNDIDYDRIHHPNSSMPWYSDNPASEPYGLATQSDGAGWVYETDGSDGIWILAHTDTFFIETPEITVNMLGLSDYGPETEYLIGLTADQQLHCWSISAGGLSLCYMGSISIPLTADAINGVAWDFNIPEKLYLSYSRGGVWYIGRFKITDTSALEPMTWGAIKGSF